LLISERHFEKKSGVFSRTPEERRDLTCKTEKRIIKHRCIGDD